ncbi:MAG TPA: hypothetical protein VF801_04375 [Rhodocyclaceae bacterium]
MNREQWLQKLRQYTEHPAARSMLAGGSAAAGVLASDSAGNTAASAAALTWRSFNQSPKQGKS